MPNITPGEYWRYRLRNYAFAHKEKWRGRLIYWLLFKKGASVMPKRVSNAVKQMRRMNKYANLYAKTIDPNATGVIIYSYPRGAPAYEIEIFGEDGNTLDVHSVEQQMLELIAESSRWRI